MLSEEEFVEALNKKQKAAATDAFRKATVAVCGLGGLGSNVSLMLARAGIGRLILTDNAFVDQSDLNRQIYKFDQIGQEKTRAIASCIEESVPACRVETHFFDLLDGDISYLSDADVIVEALDKAEIKAEFTNLALRNFPDKIVVAASGMGGLKSSDGMSTRKITDRFYFCGDGVSSADEGLYAPRVMICAAEEALTVLRLVACHESVA